MREELRIPGLGEPVSHYTDAVRFGDLLFISGLVALDKDNKLIGGDDAAEQTRKIFENMKLVLDAAGAGFGDVLKVTVFLTDINRTVINPMRAGYFGSTRPASTLVQVSKLVLPGLKVEIEAIVGLKQR